MCGKHLPIAEGEEPRRLRVSGGFSRPFESSDVGEPPRPALSGPGATGDDGGPDDDAGGEVAGLTPDPGKRPHGSGFPGGVYIEPLADDGRGSGPVLGGLDPAKNLLGVGLANGEGAHRSVIGRIRDGGAAEVSCGQSSSNAFATKGVDAMSKARPCKYCNSPVAPNAKKCPKCGGKKPYPYSSGEQMFGGVAALVVLVLVFSCCYGWPNLVGNGGGSSSGRQRSATELEAYGMIEEFVTKRLRSPGTADFPSVWDGKADHVTALGGGRFRIKSWVDAQNAFGGTVRTDFTGEIEFEPPSTWRLISLELIPR